MRLEQIPAELCARPQWVVWRIETRDGKPTKVPYNPHNGKLARTSDSEDKAARGEYRDQPRDTWGSFEEAVNCIQDHPSRYNGIGFVFTDDDPYCGIDIDKCMVDGKPTPEAKRTVKRFSSYTEKSQSGNGLHILVRGSLPFDGTRRNGFEIYHNKRYFAVTGECYPNLTEIVDRQDELDRFLSEVIAPPPPVTAKNGKPARKKATVGTDDSSLLEQARAAADGVKFSTLYDRGDTSGYIGEDGKPDDSRADLALCTILAFWTGRDFQRIDHMFRGSALFRPKWEREDYRRRTIDSAIAGCRECYDPNRSLMVTLEGVRPAIDAPESQLDTFALTEFGNADRLVDQYGTELRYCREAKDWYIWTGTQWVTGRDDEVISRAKHTIRNLKEQAHRIADTKTAAKMLTFAASSQRASQARNTTFLAQCELAVNLNVFDQDPWLFNVTNGTVLLLTGTLRPHRQTDMITKMAGCAFDPAASCPLWERFIERAIPDPEVRSFMQRACGYALSGVTTEQCFFFLFGKGANGKSVFINTILSIMGEHGHQASGNLLLANDDHKDMGIAQLVGKRFVATIEIDQGKKVAEALVKQMTGSDRLNGRLVYQNPFEFQPTHKIFMAANHRPTIKGTDSAIWRRIMLVPFTQTIAEDEQDPDLTHKLSEERSGILNWCIQGCLDWQRNSGGKHLGLQAPAAVKAATREYREEQDTIGRFVRECCNTGHEQENVLSGTLYTAYRNWCQSSEEKPASAIAFGRDLDERGFNAGRVHAGRIWNGISLNPTGQEMAQPSSGMFRNH